MLMWFIFFMIFIVMEMATVALVSIWFALGSIAALITAVFIKSILIQTIVFILVSIFALVITKPFLDKFHNKKIIPTNLDIVVGKIGIVTDEITLDKMGEVAIDGKKWTAAIDKTSSLDTFPIGSKIKILSIDGVKLMVKEVD